MKRMWKSLIKSRQLTVFKHASRDAFLDKSLSFLINTRASSTAEVTIIGGGAVGLATAYQLAKRNVKDVVLLEKTELTAGSTWHAAGLVTYFMPTVNVKKINRISIDLYKNLEKETNQDVSFHQPGSLRLLTSPIRVEEAHYHMQKQRWNLGEQYLISKDDIHKMVPFINIDMVEMGVYNPGDGHIDPYSLCQALASAARANGVKIKQRCSLLEARLTEDKEWKIHTTNGTILSKHLVNASGFWTDDVRKLCGVKHYIPNIPVHHQYVITKSIDEVKNLKQEIPVLRDLDGSYYLRQEKEGLLIGPYEASSKMKIEENWIISGIPKDFGKELFASDLERIMSHLERAMMLFPVLSSVEIASVIAGPITYNCENAPLLGPVQGYHNFWNMSGFGYGIAQAGGAGKFIADWIIDEEPPFELMDLDSDRYGRWVDRKFAAAKARESYGMNNSPGYPREERFTGRPTVRCSPLYKMLKEKGAEFGYHSVWDQPHWFAELDAEIGYKPSFRRTNWFSAAIREAKEVLGGAGIIDLSSFAKFLVVGSKAAEFLDKLSANNLPKTGFTCISHLLTHRGNVFAEITLTRLSEQKFMIVTGSASEFHDLAWMEKFKTKWKYSDAEVKIINESDNLMVLGIAGPLSRDILSSVIEEDFSEKQWKFLQHKSTHLNDNPIQAIRISYSGELGWEIYCHRNDVKAVYKSIVHAGQKHGLCHFGAFAMNSLRIEKGFRMWGNEMNCDTNPIEAGLGFFVKTKKKTDFVGKGSIQEIVKQKPLSRKIVFLKVDTLDVDPDGNEPVFYNNEVVGHTTSGCYGADVDYSLAMAYVPTELAVDNTEVLVELMGSQRGATVMTDAPIKIHSQREK